MAHVKRLDSGRWQARYRDPEHHEHAHNFRTRAAAQSWLDTVTAALVRGDYADPRSGRLVLGQLAETWYETTQTLKTFDTPGLPKPAQPPCATAVG
jgi:hypothetical protein